jgi:ABC-type transport system substrate-binding protein
MNMLTLPLAVGIVMNLLMVLWIAIALFLIMIVLIQKAKGISDQEARIELYQQAQKIFKEQAPWATIAHSIQTAPMSKTVSGFMMDPLGHYAFEGVDIAE